MPNTIVENLCIELHPAQFDFYWDPTFASLFVGGVGSGKTFVGARKALHKSLRYPRTLGLIAANTHTQLAQSTLVELYNALAELGMIEGEDFVMNKRPPMSWKTQSRFSRHAGVLTLRAGSQIVTRSLYNWRPILGLTLGWAWIDEARDASLEAFRAVLSRLRCNKVRKHQLFITTTPNGFDWLYDFFEADPGRKPELHRQRRTHLARTRDNAANLPGEYLDMLQGAYDPRLALQELEGRWVDVYQGRAYYAFDRQVHVSENAKIDRRLPVYLCCDFNVSPMTWLVAQKVRSGSLAEQSGLQPEMLIVGDQIVLNTSSTQEALEEYLSRGYDAGKTVVFGDAAGHHSTTLSDYATLRAAGFSDIRVPRKNPPVLDRVAALNGKLKNTRDQAGVLIHPKCSALIEDLARVGFKPGTRRLDKSNPALTHASDALGYCVVSLWPVHKANKLQIRQESY